jgi:hypothetical protein
MPITLPNLDDRRYADLMEEARDLLVTHAPALTNHNPSDPVVTLTELFAYFTEVLLFRVNNVTDAHRTKFLRLLNGPDWPIPASREALDAEVRRTVLALRQTDRAVTTADFEFLATAADPAGRIARAHCIAARNLEATDTAARQLPQPSHVSVVLVPFPNADLAELRTIVANYLEPRRLLTARVHVVGARVVPVRIQLTLRLLPDALETQVRPRVVDALRAFLDPIVGRDGSGWPLGRNLYVSEIYRLLDTLPGVDFVRRTADPVSSHDRDELATTSDFAARLVRNDAGELISIALDADELVDYQPPLPNSATADDLVIEQPPTTV